LPTFLESLTARTAGGPLVVTPAKVGVQEGRGADGLGTPKATYRVGEPYPLVTTLSFLRRQESRHRGRKDCARYVSTLAFWMSAGPLPPWSGLQPQLKERKGHVAQPPSAGDSNSQQELQLTAGGGCATRPPRPFLPGKQEVAPLHCRGDRPAPGTAVRAIPDRAFILLKALDTGVNRIMFRAPVRLPEQAAKRA
jgi:hypothetical protein